MIISKELIYCKKHEEPEHYCYTDQLDFKKIQQCSQCKEGNININQFDEINSKLASIIKENNDYKFSKIDQIFLIFKNVNFLFYTIDTLIDFITDISEKLKIYDLKIKKCLEKFYNLTAEEIQINHQNYKSMWQNIEEKFKVQVQNFVPQEEIDDQIDHLYESQGNGFEGASDKYCYKLLKQSQIYQQEPCQAMCFDQDDSIFVAGCGMKIKIFHFENEQLLEKEELSGFESQVNCLKFISCGYKTQLLSSFQDGHVLIWKYEKGKFIQHQQLKGHNGRVNCIEFFEGRIVTGGDDHFIIFWHKYYDKWIVSQKLQSQGSVLSLSFQDGCTEFISSEEKNKILVYSQLGMTCFQFQLIQLQQDIKRLKFCQNIFLFTEAQSNQLLVYKLKGHKYERVDQIQLNEKLNGKGQDKLRFPICFAKNGFAVKHSNCLNVIVKTKKNKQIKLKQRQTIQFDTENFIGCVSNNEKHLITWDEASKQFHIRQLMKLKN